MRLKLVILLCIGLGGCAESPVMPETMTRVDGPLPVDFSGSWERDYSRGDELNGALQDAWYRLSRTIPDQQRFGAPPGSASAPAREYDALIALARLAELITRSDVLTIVQDSHDIRIEREDDFALTCAFYDGRARPVETPYGAEVCGWDSEHLVSDLLLAEGLRIQHRFTISPDRGSLRVVTTLSSPTARVPFTLRKFYRRFERPARDFNCVETLSMKRVCSTGEIEL